MFNFRHSLYLCAAPEVREASTFMYSFFLSLNTFLEVAFCELSTGPSTKNTTVRRKEMDPTPWDHYINSALSILSEKQRSPQKVLD